MTNVELSLVERLTPEFVAMSPLQKWETLALNGLLGTDEPWIPHMREALQAQAARIEALETTVRMAAERLSVEAQLADPSQAGMSLRAKMGGIAADLFQALSTLSPARMRDNKGD